MIYCAMLLTYKTWKTQNWLDDSVGKDACHHAQNLNSIPEAHEVEGKSQKLQVCPLIYICTQINKNVIEFF